MNEMEAREYKRKEEYQEELRRIQAEWLASYIEKADRDRNVIIVGAVIFLGILLAILAGAL